MVTHYSELSHFNFRRDNMLSNKAKAPYNAVQTNTPRAKAVTACQKAPATAASPVVFSAVTRKRIRWIPSISTKRDTRNVNIAVRPSPVTLIETRAKEFRIANRALQGFASSEA